jgi:hypothetical protein
MNRSSMSKQMMQEGGPVVPSKEEFAAMTPEQQAAQKKKAMMQNLNLTPKEKAAKEAMEKENMGDKPKKMARGGMTKRMMGASNAPESGPTKLMVPPKPKPKPKGPAPYDDSDPKPRKMKSGGKVRGYGMARGGKACKMR